ncbi:hypothetical protein HPB51_008623 [Rhipicephalus microplus]|uniref:Uncharacterized protein n=1 Tax=Rhipicephalus microplus TaxID=6941 RepID=A0A9J6ENW6_RHIMP|nr:hypothetical protein HPB51_008623 [Rhipicephalus microplus]
MFGKQEVKTTRRIFVDAETPWPQDRGISRTALPIQEALAGCGRQRGFGPSIQWRLRKRTVIASMGSVYNSCAEHFATCKTLDSVAHEVLRALNSSLYVIAYDRGKSGAQHIGCRVQPGQVLRYFETMLALFDKASADAAHYEHLRSLVKLDGEVPDVTRIATDDEITLPLEQLDVEEIPHEMLASPVNRVQPLDSEASSATEIVVNGIDGVCNAFSVVARTDSWVLSMYLLVLVTSQAIRYELHERYAEVEQRVDWTYVACREILSRLFPGHYSTMEATALREHKHKKVPASELLEEAKAHLTVVLLARIVRELLVALAPVLVDTHACSPLPRDSVDLVSKSRAVKMSRQARSLRVAHQAYKKQNRLWDGIVESGVDAFHRKFFQAFCVQLRSRTLLEPTPSLPHMRKRCEFSVRSMPEFWEAYKCPEEPMKQSATLDFLVPRQRR